MQAAMNFYYDVFGGSLRNLRSVDQVDEDEPYPIDIRRGGSGNDVILRRR